MKFNFLILFFLLSCVPVNYNNISKSTFSTSGFVYVFNENDFKNKIINRKLDNNKLQIGHRYLKVGTLVKISDPDTKVSFTAKINKKMQYPDFYTIIITEAVAQKLKLDKNTPFVDIREIKKNKSFIASKAKTFHEESKVFSKAPVTTVKIDTILNTTKESKKKQKEFNIIIANFYSFKSANNLKNILTGEIPNISNKKLKVIKKKKNSYLLISGKYKTINYLKNDYIALKNHGFEELEIELNE
jgi:hypothetical protein